MGSFWEKLEQVKQTIKVQKKNYLIFGIINLIYMGTYYVIMYMDIVTSAIGYGFFNLLTLPIYLIIYGILAYSLTKQVALPNIFQGIFWAVGSSILGIAITIAGEGPVADLFTSDQINLFSIILFFLAFIINLLHPGAMFAIISAAFSAITKKVTMSQQKRMNQATQSTPPAQPPEDQ